MKKLCFLLLLLMGVGSMQAQYSLVLDTTQSTVGWTGSNFAELNKQRGTLKFSGGGIDMKEGLIQSGRFSIDMRTLADTEGASKNALITFLKSPLFFDVGMYPEATLEISRVYYNTDDTLDVEGFLTLKGVRNFITFKASLASEARAMVLRSQLKLDRNRWKVDYANENLMGPHKHDVISNIIELDVNIRFEDGC
ncbi:YceI family protein [Sediminicola luteus]|uniref:Lipid/polyisoprenoid-binding YceI-like domain-containing protein n=1 Tax=Sediminicola luteus TaxID=319238 RepID=A0A2A4G4N3_9FLAO|nr:YceI family protein [Sediminicola luteus]PCE62940.1 hypothetical protein B7P33_16830 [Sediminicola luteus]